MRLDLTHPQFTQAQVVGITGLAPKTLQNWASRGIIELAEQNPGRQAKRLYSALDIIKLGFISRIVDGSGVSASVASMFADQIADRALEWWAEKPEEKDHEGRLGVSIKSWEMDRYKVAALYISGGVPVMREVPPEDRDLLRTILPTVYVTVEIDILISSYLNKILEIAAKPAARAKRALRRRKVAAPSAETMRRAGDRLSAAIRRSLDRD